MEMSLSLLPDWYDQAACLGSDNDIFFGYGTKEAVNFCQTQCNVIDECGYYAASDPHLDYGVWGGMNINQRVKLRRSWKHDAAD